MKSLQCSFEVHILFSDLPSDILKCHHHSFTEGFIKNEVGILNPLCGIGFNSLSLGRYTHIMDKFCSATHSAELQIYQICVSIYMFTVIHAS